MMYGYKKIENKKMAIKKLKEAEKEIDTELKEAEKEIDAELKEAEKKLEAELKETGKKLDADLKEVNRELREAEKESKEDKKTARGVQTSKWWQKALYTLGISAWVFIALMLSGELVGLIMGLLLPNATISPLVNTVFSTIIYLVALVITVWLPAKVCKKIVQPNTRERMGLRGLPTWTDIGLGAVGYGASILISGGLTLVFEQFSWFNVDEAQELGYSFFMQGWEKALAFILLAIVAPVIEELIFRGWLYGKLRIKVPKVVAILTTSLLFGLVHMQWNVGISVFAMSMVMCTLREVTGTIYAGTLVHMINNSIAFFLTYVIGMV